MGIVNDDIARVRAATDIVAIIGEHTEIKRTGRQWMARCPLHGERTPSLSVSPDKGVYYCFGCQRSGDVITFVQEIEGLDFTAAVEALAGRAGIRLQYTSNDESAARSRRRKLLESVAEARDFYHDRLLKGADAGTARSYLRSRGYDGELVRRWKIGWAPDDWDQLAGRLRLSGDDLREAGLGLVNRAGRLQDFFRGRIMFPITDERGDTVGFGGRVMPGADGPKYLNTSSEARPYDKSKVLYGLHEHRRAIVKAGRAVVCEGYTDVIGCAVAGIDIAVATCGTALTADHVRLLKRFSADTLVMAFDADAAGAAAAGRVYAWEREFELQVLVADLPEGRDPGDLGRNDPDALKAAIDAAVPLLQFRVDRVLAGADLSTIESRARAAERAVAVVNEHPDPMVRDPRLVAVADRCGVQPEQLRRVATEAARRPTRDGASDDSAASSRHDDRLTPEDEALRLAIHRPSAVAGWLHVSLFAEPAHREAFEALAAVGLVAVAGAASVEPADLADTDNGTNPNSAATSAPPMQPGAPSSGMADATGQPGAPSGGVADATGQPGAPSGGVADATGQPGAPSGGVADATGQPGAPSSGVAAACELVSTPTAQLLHRLAVDAGDAAPADVLARVAGLTAARVMNDLRLRAASAQNAEVARQCSTSLVWLKSQSERLGERGTRAEALGVLLPWLIDYGRAGA